MATSAILGEDLAFSFVRYKFFTRCQMLFIALSLYVTSLAESLAGNNQNNQKHTSNYSLQGMIHERHDDWYDCRIHKFLRYYELW